MDTALVEELATIDTTRLWLELITRRLRRVDQREREKVKERQRLRTFNLRGLWYTKMVRRDPDSMLRF